MISTSCGCGSALETEETSTSQVMSCGQCGAEVHFAAAEEIPAGAGLGDFDARLVVLVGPQFVGRQIHLGGVADIEIGKLAEKTVSLPGQRVSRNHCRLVRVDFGPSRWKLVDNRSTNGVFVNNDRVEEMELQDGDELAIGDYLLRYEHAADPAHALPPPPLDGVTCPGCGQTYGKNAKICTTCGIDMHTGRAIVISKGIDENDLAIRADTWIRTVSWLVPFGLFPIASEAFGTVKPRVTFILTAITILTSIAGFTVLWSKDDPSDSFMNLLHWTGARENPDPAVSKLISDSGSDKDRKLSKEELEALVESAPKDYSANVGPRWYQPLTAAFLHIDIMHVAGNLLFLLVFGMRVNELVGHWKFAVLYPLLAFGSGWIDSLAHLNAPLTPNLGASGAIMGLAGMYFVFFPVQKVHTAIWIRAGILTRWQCFYKVFQMHGFWLLVLWVGLNDILPTVLGSRDHIGHWAHLGGFMVGMFLALLLLVTRLTNGHGNDLLSVTLGKHAWAIIGKPRHD